MEQEHSTDSNRSTNKRKAEAIDPIDGRSGGPEEEEEEEDDLSFVDQLSVSELKRMLEERKVSSVDLIDKQELVQRVKEALLTIDKKEGLPLHRAKKEPRRDCPYLDTINRTLLDFDFEKLCSVTLLNLNVYACLVCGKYFQGRGKQSQAYVHSLQADHHVFINLHDERVYCLPDGYEVIDSSLADIKYNLNPKFTVEEVNKLDLNTKQSTALDGTEFLPGYVGLNNIKVTDYLNAALQALVHIPLFRNFFIQEANYRASHIPLIHRFGELVRKIYNPKNFKAHVDPHELLQAVSVASEKKFHIGVPGDPMEFIQWFLNYVHRTLGGIVYKSFQGQLEVVTISDETKEEGTFEKIETTRVPFLNLTLEVPPPPLFQEEGEATIIPQVPIFNLLEKFDGETETPLPNSVRKRYSITKLPPYLILHIKRFTKNQFFSEKNPTIVTSPLKNFDFKDYLKEGILKPGMITKYDLIANIIHEGEPRKGTYKADIYQKGTKQWYEIQDLHVRPMLPQLIALSESYIQIFERQNQ